MAGVVAVLVSVLSIAEGIRATMINTGSPDSAIVMRTGSDSEMTSILMREDIDVVKDSPEIARSPGVGPLASAELFVGIDLVKASTGTTANASLRGVEPAAFSLRKFRMIEGRVFETGRNELVVGRSAANEYRGLDVGSELKLGQNVWQIVGIFDAGGTVPDSELWCDGGVLAPLYRRGNSRQAVYVRLTSPEAFTPFKDRLTADPRVKLKVMREQEYYAGQSELLSDTIVFIGGVIGLLMGVGALFVAVITMHSAVASRTREIATLRALGFRGGPVVISVLVESMMLALARGRPRRRRRLPRLQRLRGRDDELAEHEHSRIRVPRHAVAARARGRLGAGARPARRPLSRHQGDAAAHRDGAQGTVVATDGYRSTTHTSPLSPTM